MYCVMWLGKSAQQQHNQDNVRAQKYIISLHTGAWSKLSEEKCSPKLNLSYQINTQWNQRARM